MKVKHSESFIHSVGTKVKQTAEIIGALKAIYDTGRAVATAVGGAAPVLVLL